MVTDNSHLEDTLPLDDEDISANSSLEASESNNNGFPIVVSSRFTYVKRLGRGGSALVYQAFDNVLERHVALKFLLNPKQKNQARLVSEARSQANVEHSNICPIYEVIETENSVYLVMQFIEGESLQDLSPTLSSEQILLLLKKSALGLHTAHMQGMIHRDFKPANVMVNLASGDMDAKIVDFGLAAQDISKDNKTSKLAGTTGFISPEQYKGNFTKIDRSSDIYSLGACLLYCLTGKLLVIDKSNTVENTAESQTLKNQTSESDTLKSQTLKSHTSNSKAPASKELSINDPPISEPSITELLANTSLPKDVQIIIAKSMALESQERYQSALELADDIGRYLAGEPIKARSSKGYWISRKLIKHKWLATAAFIAVVGVLGMYVKQVYQQKQQEQQQLVREQGLLKINNKINDLEYQAQLTYMSPRHNIETQLQQWLNDAEQLEQDLPDINPILLGATHYGIGRIYQVLGETVKATEHLEQAHQLEKIDDTAFYLALAYSELYQQQLSVLRNIADKNVKESRIIELHKKYKIPTVSLLNQHIDSAPYRSYANALLTYYQQDWDAAIDILNKSEDLPVWYYADDVLKGDILLAKANKLNQSGSSIDLIEPLLQQAGVYYQNASAIAPSDPSIVLKQVSTITSELAMFNQLGRTAESHLLDKAQDLRSNVLEISKLNGDVYHTFGLLYFNYGLNLDYNNGTSDKWLNLAESEFINAENYRTKIGDVWLSFASLFSHQIKLQRELNIDTSDTIKKAIDALSKVSDEAKDYYYFNELGILNRYRALDVRDKGGDDKALFEASIFNYIEANKRFPERIGSLINAASTLMLMSGPYSLNDRYMALQKAESLLLKVLGKEPEHFVANYYLAVTKVNLFELSVYQGLLLKDIAKNAAEQMSRTKSISSNSPYVLDLEQKLKLLEYANEFENTGLWNNDFDKLIAARAELVKTFVQNNVVTRNFIRVLGVITGIRVQLGLPANSYIDKLEQALNDYPEFESVEAYRALSELFRHWNTPDIAKLNLISEFKLRDKRSHSNDWALAMVLIATAKKTEEIEEATELLNSNKGLLPAYRELVLKWADEKNYLKKNEQKTILKLE
jgi:serine/threonine-protein kinase